MADAAVKPKTLVPMKMTGTCPTHARTDIFVRDVEIVVDEPTERGGTNIGATPTEMLLAALISCSNVVGQRIAHREGIEFGSLSFDAKRFSIGVVRPSSRPSIFPSSASRLRSTARPRRPTTSSTSPSAICRAIAPSRRPCAIRGPRSKPCGT